ncbi:Slp family lipoprotein [Nitrospira moscoviensis]|uniref:Putative Outer membrane lipoprotein Slp n=1 Tax=Nitrospira moscoviensis TaxID=42253 RepID=A0A0K2G8S3_NITMO|nr:Slp family lipoprotein [Nitrospira moscoviensis]ALA56992.1 putative Outer membrane lipoprotein Slp [Nitrospira moscoviensis]
MHGRRPLLLASSLLMLCGCASTDEADQPALPAPQIGFTQIKAAPEAFQGRAVTFGGQVLAARRLKDGTRIEILQLPLASSLQPIPNLSESEGRFVAMQREFLDPATIPPGTLITVHGDLTGSVTLPLDETDYIYPLVEIKNLRVWQREDQPVRMAPYPYMGPRPFWGPYWRPYPYW